MQLLNLACLADLLPGIVPSSAPVSIWVVNLLATALVSALLLRGRLRSLPRDLVDTARIDGCGFWRVCWHVLLPRVRPTLGAIGVVILVAASDDIIAARIEPMGSFFGAHFDAISLGMGSIRIAMLLSLVLVPTVIAAIFLARQYTSRADRPPA
jgi:ABC-type glycerol-3-phosphate transport system permease component